MEKKILLLLCITVNLSSCGTPYGIVDIYANDGLKPLVYSTGTRIRNNVFYTVNQICNINIVEAGDTMGFDSDYNVFWCESGTPMFKYLGVEKTFGEWQDLGYDKHSVVINPDFIDLTDFVPRNRLEYGTYLGEAWKTGLSVKAAWNVGSSPDTTDQNGKWQAAARIY